MSVLLIETHRDWHRLLKKGLKQLLLIVSFRFARRKTKRLNHSFETSILPVKGLWQLKLK